MLQVSDVHKVYGDDVVLERVNFIVNHGDRVGLVGPNGCGKTTLLRIVIGEELPDQGSVSWQPPDLRIGYLEQADQEGGGLPSGFRLDLRTLSLALGLVARDHRRGGKADSQHHAGHSRTGDDGEAAIAALQFPLAQVVETKP